MCTLQRPYEVQDTPNTDSLCRRLPFVPHAVHACPWVGMSERIVAHIVMVLFRQGEERCGYLTDYVRGRSWGGGDNH
jgi:hypothetical protein